MFGMYKTVVGAFEAEQQHYHDECRTRKTQQCGQQVTAEELARYGQQQADAVAYPKRYPPGHWQQQVLMQHDIQAGYQRNGHHQQKPGQQQVLAYSEIKIIDVAPEQFVPSLFPVMTQVYQLTG